MSGYADDVTYSRSISSPADESTVVDDLATICNRQSSKDFRLNINKVTAMMISRKKSPPMMYGEALWYKVSAVQRLCGQIPQVRCQHH